MTSASINIITGTPFAVTFNNGTNTFTITGSNVTNLFPANAILTAIGGPPNGGYQKVVSSAFSGGNTVVTVASYPTGTAYPGPATFTTGTGTIILMTNSASSSSPWALQFNDATGNNSFQQIVIAPLSIGAVAVGSNQSYNSTDGGITWNAITIPGNGVGPGVFYTGSAFFVATGSGAGGPGHINSYGSIVAGSGYIDSTYNNVPLTGGTGTGGLAQIVVSGGGVTTVTRVNDGSGYTVGDTLSASNTNLGGSGSGFSVQVTSIGVQTLFYSTDVGVTWTGLTIPGTDPSENAIAVAVEAATGNIFLFQQSGNNGLLGNVDVWRVDPNTFTVTEVITGAQGPNPGGGGGGVHGGVVAGGSSTLDFTTNSFWDPQGANDVWNGTAWVISMPAGNGVGSNLGIDAGSRPWTVGYRPTVCNITVSCVPDTNIELDVFDQNGQDLLGSATQVLTSTPTVISIPLDYSTAIANFDNPDIGQINPFNPLYNSNTALAAAVTFHDISFSAQTLVSVFSFAGAANKVWISANSGSTWTSPFSFPVFPPDNFNPVNIQYNGTEWSIYGDGANTNKFFNYTSTDGSTWTQRSYAPNGPPYPFAVALLGTTFLSTNAIASVASSPDGITWTITTPPTLTFWNAISSGNLRAYVFGDGIDESINGTTWTNQLPGTNLTSSGISDVESNGSLTLAVGQDDSNNGVIYVRTPA